MAKALLISLIFIKMAFATSFYERPFAESLKNAPITVRGKVGQSVVDSATVSDGTQLVFTFYDFKVNEVLKGDLKPSTIKIREIGGEKNGIAMSVSGSASFSSGEDVVVFLEPPVNEVYPVRGMMMGRFAIEKAADGKEYLRGPGLGSHATPNQWSMDAVRDLIQKQKDEPVNSAGGGATGNVQSSPTPKTPAEIVSGSNPAKPALGEVFTANKNSKESGEEGAKVISNEAGGTRLKERRVPSIWVVAAGIITGIYFYLRTKRRREGK